MWVVKYGFRTSSTGKFGFIRIFILENWHALLEQAGMDQRELAVALESSPSVISALVNNVTGKAAAGKKTKKKALDYLRARIRDSESVVSRHPESEVSGIELKEMPPEYNDATDWRERALKAEAEVERLRTALHEMTKPISYSKNIKKPQ
jgi:hypothetical protein